MRERQEEACADAIRMRNRRDAVGASTARGFVVRFRREMRLAWCNIKQKGCSMNKITFAVVLGIAMAGATVRADTKTTYRDSMGRIQGTVTTDRYGKTTYRDAMGRIQGTATTDRYGKTTYRDAQGRIQGTKR